MKYKYFPYNKHLTKNAQTLRKNMTEEERILWYDLLKRLPITVKRQHNIGNYIVDFYIASRNIVIELDGSQHWRDENHNKDKIRDEFLSSLGLTVLRYSNTDLKKNPEGVYGHILKHVGLTWEDLKPKTQN